MDMDDVAMQILKPRITVYGIRYTVYGVKHKGVQYRIQNESNSFSLARISLASILEIARHSSLI